ncbi:MAG: 30S ribosomal protein S8 [Omnitrophica WOR_2 bacterium RIFCSPHIGHO2_02_FULL_68_15]|nr:MAG: 30S ribosomal protein S8 [Omnitrophica WOR_2 bacterium RIFCSPHIGHO2_02_FULL_68_15]
MSQTDSLADSLTQIRNASRARLEKADLRDSRMTRAVVDLLKREGFIQNFRVVDTKPRTTLRVYLKYTKDRKPVMTQLTRVSTPGLRKYVGVQQIPQVYRGLGLSILSTSKGVMTDAEARAQKVGGELLCRVW